MFNLDEISFDIVVKTSNIVTDTGNIVAKNGNNVEATFNFVERIVRLVAFDNVASTLDIVAGVDRALRCLLYNPFRRTAFTDSQSENS